MNNKLPYKELLKYMEYVFDTEVNIFIQQETIKKLGNTYNSLGIPKKIDPPVLKKADKSGCAAAFIPCIVMSAIYWCFRLFFLMPASLDSWTSAWIIFLVIIVFTIIISILINTSEEKKESEYIYNENNNKMEQYNLAVKMDKKRVDEENKRKNYIRQQINKLDRIRRNEVNKLKDLYSFEILAPKYRNLVAVSSIYEYLKYEKTRSLGVNGGDRGAYNIFDEEMRLNHIISNTQIIIQKLDTVIDNQIELRDAIHKADNSIKQLTTSVERSLAGIERGINRMNENQEISNYEQRRNTAELEYMNFKNTLYLYK